MPKQQDNDIEFDDFELDLDEFKAASTGTQDLSDNFSSKEDSSEKLKLKENKKTDNYNSDRRSVNMLNTDKQLLQDIVYHDIDKSLFREINNMIHLLNKLLQYVDNGIDSDITQLVENALAYKYNLDLSIIDKTVDMKPHRIITKIKLSDNDIVKRITPNDKQHSISKTLHTATSVYVSAYQLIGYATTYNSLYEQVIEAVEDYLKDNSF
ncbi:hypothetical protein [Staphylococcus shinii]|uniref:hypothetical protein n=1 Tax=Staphylococcus shinii TaxID=2912228 RepID=UPI003F55B027